MEEMFPVFLAVKYAWENFWLERNLDGFWKDSSERKVSWQEWNLVFWFSLISLKT